MSKKRNEPELERVVRLALAAGMTYKEFQQKETLGLVRVGKDRLLFKGKDY